MKSCGRRCRGPALGISGQAWGVAGNTLAAMSKLANLREPKQVGHDRFATLVFIGTVRMQAVAAASGVEIDQRQGEIVAAEKPGESACRIGLPFGVACGTPGS